MADDDLVFESTTDSPEQIAAGLGLPAPEPPPPSADAATAVAAAETSSEAPSPTPAAQGELFVEASPAAPAPAVEAATPARDEKGRFVAKERPAETPAAPDMRAELDTLRTRLQALERPAAPAPTPPGTESIDRDTYRDARVTAQYDTARQALGAEPKQDDFDDYEEFRRAERAYDRKLAALDANEVYAHRAAADAEIAGQRAAYAAVRQQFETFAERQQAVKARHADFDAVMQAGMSIPFHDKTPHYRLIFEELLDHPDGPETVYYINGHAEELRLVQAQPTERAAMRELQALIGRARATAATTTAPVGATQAGPAVARFPTANTPRSRAPEPQGTAMGGGPSLGTATTPETARDYQEFKRLRNEQIRNRR